MNKLYGKLAKTNMVSNKQLYIPYLISGIFMVAMFYTMLFIRNNDGMKYMPSSGNLLIVMTLGSIVVGLFAYIFLFYTNSFISKKRKKEVGIYNILGMEKRHIAKVICIETICTAAIDLIAGLALGISFSKFLLMILYKLLRFESAIHFQVQAINIGITCLVFGILFLFILAYNLLQIKIANPIELLRGSNTGEREPKTKVVMLLLGLVCIGTGYFIAITEENPLKVIILFFVAVVLVIIGTYFLFIAGSIFILKALRKNKNYYYHKNHFSTVSGMLYRMKQNASGLASICILSTMVLVMVSTTVCLYVGVEDSTRSQYEQEIKISYRWYDYEDHFEQKDQLVRDFLQTQGRKVLDNNHYSYYTMIASLENGVFSDSVSDERVNAVNYYLEFMTKTDFERMYAKEQMIVPELKQGEVAVYCGNKTDFEDMNLFGKEVKVAYNELLPTDDTDYIYNVFKEVYTIVMEDDTLYQELFEITKNIIGQGNHSVPQFYVQTFTYEIDGSKYEKLACGKALSGYLHGIKDGSDLDWLSVDSIQMIIEEFYGVYGGFLFLGLFLGFLFLMVTVMIIFYKQISEGYDDKERFLIMEKVGMSNTEVKKTISSQIRIVFFLPLVVTVIHLMAAFPMIERLLSMFNLTNIPLFIKCLIGSVIAFAFIYYMIFKLTSRSYYKIVGNQIQA